METRAIPTLRRGGLFAAVVVLTLAQASAGGERADLKGLVQAEDGSALAGIVVVLKDAAGRELRTTANDEGRFQFAGLAAGKYQLTFLKGLSVGETIRRTAMIRELAGRLVADSLLVVWRPEPRAPAEGTFWEGVRDAMRAVPRDGLKELTAEAELPDDLEPVIEGGAPPVAASAVPSVLSGDFRLAQSFALALESPELQRGTEAGLRIDSPVWKMVSFNVTAEHRNGGSLTSPILTGDGVSGEDLRIGVEIVPSEIDRVEITTSVGRDSLATERGMLATDRVDTNVVSSLDARWFRALPDGDLTVRVQYARGALSLSGLPMVGPETLSLVQSFWTAHANYTMTSAEEHLFVVGGALRDDHAPAHLTAWPGAYDDVAGLAGVAEEDGAGVVYARDTWRMGNRLSLRYGLSAYYPVAQPSRAFAMPELGTDLKVWRDAALSLSSSYIHAPEADERTLTRELARDEDFVAFMTELRQRLPKGAQIGVFAGTRDLRSLYLQATAGETFGDLPNPLFYTSGYATTKETGVELSSAPIGQDATIALRFLKGRTDGATTVEPLQLFRRDLFLGKGALEEARVSYGQALVAIVIPRAGTAVDFSYVQVKARSERDASDTSAYSLWGGQVRQSLPFLEFREARFAVLVAANQVLQDLYRLDAITESNPRQLRVSGGIALTF